MGKQAVAQPCLMPAHMYVCKHMGKSVLTSYFFPTYSNRL